ncbi:MAG: histidine--tRNA ligase, partial [Clostridia bacterium]|nr:histidine--tRNA ligase [Clostridia bacterium]
SIKAQFKYADKLGAKYTAVIGESEMASGACNLKRMSDGQTFLTAFADIYGFLRDNK